MPPVIIYDLSDIFFSFCSLVIPTLFGITFGITSNVLTVLVPWCPFPSLNWVLNPFVPNVFFLYPLKTSEKRKFQGLQKGFIGNKWVQLSLSWGTVSHVEIVKLCILQNNLFALDFATLYRHLWYPFIFVILSQLSCFFYIHD